MDTKLGWRAAGMVAIGLAASALGACTKSSSPSANAGFTPDLVQLAAGKGGKIVNRPIEAVTDGKRKGVRLGEKADGAGEGLVRFDGFELADGVIELDVRGQNVPQKSFLGVAFHGVDDQTYDAVYFRPFNFRSDDPQRRAHAVQYVSHPDHTWRRLRDEHPGQYENQIASPPDPDGWFHVRVVISGPRVNVFVDAATAPCLEVEQLSARKSGWIGLFVGDGSGGEFANVRATATKSGDKR
jgi:hypothetical protein